MAGSWEHRKPEVLVAILNSRPVPIQWAFKFRQLRLPGASKVIFLSGMPFDHARNSGCRNALNGGFEWLFFLDDDVMVPDNAYERLSSHELDIVSGLYYRRHDPVQPVMIKELPDKNIYITNFRPGDIVQADLVGSGCLLIHRRVLERVPQPWFEWRCDREDLPERERVSEDYAFAKKARSYGFPIYVDTGVQCGHAGYGNAEMPGKFEPLPV